MPSEWNSAYVSRSPCYLAHSSGEGTSHPAPSLTCSLSSVLVPECVSLSFPLVSLICIRTFKTLHAQLLDGCGVPALCLLLGRWHGVNVYMQCLGCGAGWGHTE